MVIDGIEDVIISEDTYSGVETEVMESELVSEVSVRLQGRIVYTTIVLNSEVSVNDAKEIANDTLDNYSEEELGFYDFSYFLKWEGEDGDTVITGNKHHDLETITWVKS